MSPLPYDRDGTPSGRERGAGWTVTCPKCSKTLTRGEASVLCGNCGYAPRHGAD